MDVFWEYFAVLAPSIGVGLIFWLAMRSLFRGDAKERSARAAAEEREAQIWAEQKAAEGTATRTETSRADTPRN